VRVLVRGRRGVGMVGVVVVAVLVAVGVVPMNADAIAVAFGQGGMNVSPRGGGDSILG